MFGDERVSFGFRKREETIPEHPSMSPFPSSNTAAAIPRTRRHVSHMVYEKVISRFERILAP